MYESQNKNSIHTAQGDSIAVILGSAFSESPPQGVELDPIEVSTPWGTVVLYEAKRLRRSERAFVIFRHGIPHDTLPHQVNYRAYAFALKRVKCQALLVTSSVGVLDPRVPLDQPLLIADLLMPDNRLPNGELCTMFAHPPTFESDHSHHTTPNHDPLAPGHLVIREGLCSLELSQQVLRCLSNRGHLDPASLSASEVSRVIFAYAPGPRTKTPAENHYWLTLGAQVNSMSIGPELVLANELEIPTAGLVIGHKRSNAAIVTQKNLTLATQPHLDSSQHGRREMTETLERSHSLLEEIVVNFLRTASPVPFMNYIYRFPPPPDPIDNRKI